MINYFLQSMPPSPPSGPGVPVMAGLMMLLPALMVITGTVLGFRALHDIRLAEGRLGGAMLATVAGGLLPGIFIVIGCGFAFHEVLGGFAPPGRRRSDAWLTIGCGAGLWLTFLMMRGMYRGATGWQRPRPEPNAARHSALTTAAIILTVISIALVLYVLVDARGPQQAAWQFGERRVLMTEAAMLLLPAGFTCGILARAERPARVCAWICGSLFAVILLLSA